MENQQYDIPEGVEVIDEDAFSSGVLLTSVSLPFSLKKINKRAFYNNQYLTKIVIPESVELIESYAFAHNTNLEEVFIVSKNIEIEENSFFGCEKLHNVMIASESIEVEENIFDKCDSLKEIQMLPLSEGNDIDIDGVVINNNINKGSCGEHCFSILKIENASLSIFGYGEITTMEGITEDQKQLVEEIHISKELTSIKSYLFKEYSELELVTYASLNDFISC